MLANDKKNKGTKIIISVILEDFFFLLIPTPRPTKNKEIAMKIRKNKIDKLGETSFKLTGGIILFGINTEKMPTTKTINENK